MYRNFPRKASQVSWKWLAFPTSNYGLALACVGHILWWWQSHVSMTFPCLHHHKRPPISYKQNFVVGFCHQLLICGSTSQGEGESVPSRKWRQWGPLAYCWSGLDRIVMISKSIIHTNELFLLSFKVQGKNIHDASSSWGGMVLWWWKIGNTESPWELSMKRWAHHMVIHMIFWWSHLIKGVDLQNMESTCTSSKYGRQISCLVEYPM